MKDYAPNYPNRRHEPLFYVPDGHEPGPVKKVQGFVCHPHDDLFWCPEVRVSATVGIHLFRTFLEAKHKRIENVLTTLHRLQRELVSAQSETESQ